MEKRKDKKQIVIGITILLLVTLILLGLTYAYYRTNVIGNSGTKSVSIGSKKLSVTYVDGNDQVVGGIVSPGDEFTKEFTVENTGDETAEYSVKLENVTNEFSRLKDWTFELKKGETVVSSGEVPNTDSFILNKTTIEESDTDSYTLKVSYASSDEDQSEDMGKELSLKVNISNTIGEIFETAGDNTLLKAIGKDNLIAEPLTKPGQEPSTSNEAELSYTEDDYGTSYYYRGKVDNNFVTMGDMCWRIVRVQGNGSLKITLYDETHSCPTSVSNEKGFFAGYGNDGVLAPYKTKRYTSSPSGDGTFGGSDVESALEDWYNYPNLNLKNYENQIEQEAKWCNDLSVSEEVQDSTYYGAYGRLKTANPSLRCPSMGNADLESTVYTGKIALLTVDEVAFAGGTDGDSTNPSGYLLENFASGMEGYLNYYWTMSPQQLASPSFLMVYMVNAWSGNISGRPGGPAATQGALRPTLILKSNVTINEGANGTKTNPYVIKAN